MASGLVVRVALAVVAALSVLLVRLAPSYRQKRIAATLVGLCVVDWARADMPLKTVRVALFCGWYAILAIGVGVVLNGHRRTWTTPSQRSVARHDRALMAIAYAGCLVTIAGAAVYRGGMTMPLSRAAFALALAVQLVALVLFIYRAEEPDDAQRVALVLVFSSLVDALPGPWLLGAPVRDWNVGRAISLATWIVIAGWEVRCLIRARKASV